MASITGLIGLVDSLPETSRAGWTRLPPIRPVLCGNQVLLLTRFQNLLCHRPAKLLISCLRQCLSVLLSRNTTVALGGVRPMGMRYDQQTDSLLLFKSGLLSLRSTSTIPTGHWGSWRGCRVVCSCWRSNRLMASCREEFMTTSKLEGSKRNSSLTRRLTSFSVCSDPIHVPTVRRHVVPVHPYQGLE